MKYFPHLLALLVFSPFSFGENEFVQMMFDQQLIQSGKVSYEKHCSGCHGTDAKGAGPSSGMLNPKPRNLVEGSYKWRSTPSGVLPTVQDLLRTLEVGVIGVSMPSFKELPNSEKLALVAYLRSLRPEFSDTLKDQVSVSLPPPPAEIFSTKSGILAAAKKGRVLYKQACYLCHGENGAGDGPSAETLTDDNDLPIAPANLNLPYVKGGKTIKDLFRSITTGLDGSPMPGFGQVFTDQQRWEMVAYIYYLRGVKAGIYSVEDQLK